MLERPARQFGDGGPWIGYGLAGQGLHLQAGSRQCPYQSPDNRFLSRVALHGADCQAGNTPYHQQSYLNSSRSCEAQDWRNGQLSTPRRKPAFPLRRTQSFCCSRTADLRFFAPSAGESIRGKPRNRPLFRGSGRRSGLAVRRRAPNSAGTYRSANAGNKPPACKWTSRSDRAGRPCPPTCPCWGTSFPFPGRTSPAAWELPPA